ncbi:iron chelate uptake ABC transporter family permease subunit, partial [Nonomuraea insulae]
MTPIVSPHDALRQVSRTRSRVAGRRRAVTAGLALAALLAFCLSLSVGDFTISVLRVLPAVFGSGEGGEVFVVQSLRLPRALLAVLVGAAFGMSGAVFQSLARNPLGSPDIIGVNAGAAAGAVLMILVAGSEST